MMESIATADVTLCFHRSLKRSANQLRRLYDQMLAPSGLRIHEFGLLAYIQRSPSIGIVDLADAFLFDRATLRYKLAPLETAGFVVVLPDPRDRRMRRIAMTEAGRDKLAAASGLWLAAQKRFATVLGTDEAQALRSAADKVASPAFAASFDA